VAGPALRRVCSQDEHRGKRASPRGASPLASSPTITLYYRIVGNPPRDASGPAGEAFGGTISVSYRIAGKHPPCACGVGFMGRF
jgi:hypothetical protein